MRKQAACIVLENIPRAIFPSFPLYPLSLSLSLSLFLSLSRATPGTNSNKRTTAAHGGFYRAWKMENTPRKHDPPPPSETRCRVDFADEGWQSSWGETAKRFAPISPASSSASPEPGAGRRGWMIVWRFTDECRPSYNCNEP